jgi:hypothetical protein
LKKEITFKIYERRKVFLLYEAANVQFNNEKSSLIVDLTRDSC